MTNQLDLRDLRYFEAIAEAGHLGRAAEKVHRSQPALTGCVRRLEEALGTALFERVGRGIRLTAAGEALARRARSLRVAARSRKSGRAFPATCASACCRRSRGSSCLRFAACSSRMRLA
jgi:molybdenum-dependent DNA-binding transcriptional regulator ModE